jgi:hypothetical protein
MSPATRGSFGVGARSRRDEVAAHFRSQGSVCDAAQADNAVSWVVVVAGPDAVVFGVSRRPFG